MAKVKKSKGKRRNITYKDWITAEGLIRINGWAMDGLTNEEICEMIGIHVSTIYDWQKKYPEIKEALRVGKDVADRQVEQALFNRALGSEYEETKIIIERDDNGKEKKRQEKVMKKIMPSVEAQKFWLKNRKPETWRDKIENEITGKDGGAIEIRDARQILIERLTKGKE